MICVYTRLIICLLSCGVMFAQSVQEYSRHASQLALRYEWKEAIEVLQTGLKHYPDDPNLLLQLGSLLVRTGRSSEGAKLLAKALQMEPDNPEALQSAATAELQKGRFSAAVALLKASLRQGAPDAQAHYHLGFALLAQGDENGAIEHARRAVDINPVEPKFRKLYALLLESQNRSEESYQQLKLAFQLTPHDPHLLFQLGQKRLSSGDLLQALEFLELAIEEDPENPLYHDRLADIYERVGDKESAQAEKQKAQQLSHAFQEYVRALGLSTQGKKRQAIDILAPSIERLPEFTTGAMFLASLYEKMGKSEEAFEIYLKILKTSPGQSVARERGAWIQARRGSFDSALRLLSETDERTPSRTLIDAYRRLAQEDWTGALEQFQTIERQYPLNFELLQVIGLCFKAQGKNEEALDYFQKARKLRPDDARIQQYIREIKFQDALKLISERKWRAALTAFENLLKQDIHAEYLLRMAYCHQQLGDIAQAVKKYQAGLHVDPTATWARINLASSLSLLQRYEEAAQQWQNVLKTYKRADAYFQLGICYSHLGRHPEAEYAFEKALRYGDDRPETLYHLGVARIENNKPEAAWHLIQQSAETGYGPARDLLEQR